MRWSGASPPSRLPRSCSLAEDQFALPEYQAMVERLPHARRQVIPGGMVPMPDQMPEAFSAAVLDFLLSGVPVKVLRS